MTCRHARACFSAYVDQDLEMQERALLVAHLRACRGCTRELQALEAALRALADMPRAQSSDVAGAVLDRISLERRGPGLQLLFRSARRARPFMLRSLVHAAFVFVFLMSGAVWLSRFLGPSSSSDLPEVKTAWEPRLPPSGTEGNPLFPSAGVAVPQLRKRGVDEPFLSPEGEGSVFLETVVARDGSVSTVTVLGGDREDARLLTEALRRERFEPTRLGGRPVAVSVYRLFSRMEVRGT